MSEKSLKLRSSPEQINEALKRAVKVLKGNEKLTFTAVARRATLYVPEGKVYLEDVLKSMTEEELEAIGYRPRPSPAAVQLPATRHIKSGHWCANRAIRPRFKT
jgi:hypothetical protein